MRLTPFAPKSANLKSNQVFLYKAIIQNPNPFTISLGLPESLGKVSASVIYALRNSPQTGLQFPTETADVKYDIEGADPTIVKNFSVFSLEPNATVTITFFVELKRERCTYVVARESLATYYGNLAGLAFQWIGVDKIGIAIGRETEESDSFTPHGTMSLVKNGASTEKQYQRWNSQSSLSGFTSLTAVKVDVQQCL
jgi:hypothetical protein